MLGQPGKGEIKLKCQECPFPEFPHLLFGTDKDNRSYFDATHYLKQTNSELSVQAFITQYRYQIKNLCEAYQIKSDTVCLVNEEGHYIIDGAFVFLFIAFSEPYFLAYVCERVLELFSYGVSVSDSYLLQALKSRMPDVAEKVTSNDENPK